MLHTFQGEPGTSALCVPSQPLPLSASGASWQPSLPVPGYPSLSKQPAVSAVSLVLCDAVTPL